MIDTYYIDGEFVTAGQATLPITDLAVLRGYGVFDFMRTYHGIPFHLDAHIDRLYRSAEIIGLEMPWDKEDVRAIVIETVGRNSHHSEANVRIVVTGGTSEDYITPDGNPRLAVLVTKAVPPADHYYINGAKIVTFHETRALPGAKSLNYISAIRALKIAKAKNAVEAIYVNEKTHALEGTTTNLFAFFGSKLVTPPDDAVLPGITRSVVLEATKPVFELEIRELHLEELHQADEVFITASNKQVMPVVQVDDHIIAEGRPGINTRTVMNLFAEETGVALPQ